MSNQTKLRAKSPGQPDSEVARFKKLWRESWDEPVRDSLRHLFSTDTSQADARAEIKLKHGVALLWNSQHSKLKAWIAEQDALDEEAEKQDAEEQDLKRRHPDWGPEELREAVLAGAYRRSLSRGDFKLGLASVDRDLKIREGARDERKLKLQEQKAAAYDRAQAALTEAREAPGGLTSETIAKIERELNLL